MKDIRLNLAREALDRGDFAEAVRRYGAALLQAPHLRAVLAFSLQLARQGHRQSRQGAVPHVAVCGWDLSHNAAGRVRALAHAHAAGGAEVTVIGALLPQWRGALWEPLRDEAFPLHLIEVSDEGGFPLQAVEFVLAHPFDVVHLSKPRLPNLLIGLLYKLFWDARVVMDVDDEELGSVGAEAPCGLEALPRTPGGQPRLRGLAGKLWTQVAVGLAGAFDAVTVSNAALQARYGGAIVPHCRAAPEFAAALPQRAATRARLGLPETATVVLFFGTVRRHKGLLDIAGAVAGLDRPDLCLAVVGDCPHPDLRDEIAALAGPRVVFAGVQPYARLAEVAVAGDVCVLMQDAETVLGQFQIPAKLTDALAAGLLVLAQRTPGLAPVLEAGAATEVTRETLAADLAALLDDPARAKAQRAAGRAYFQTHLTLEAAAAALAPLALQPPPAPLEAGLLPPRLQEVFDALGSWELWRSDGSLPHGPGFAPDPQGRRLVVYTVLTGRYEPLKVPQVCDPEARYILFTDDPDLTSEQWEVVRFDTLGLDPRRASRLPKLLAHRYLPDHDVSVYLDASLTLRAGGLAALAERLLAGRDLAAFSHFKRDCVLDEIEECLRLGKADPGSVAEFRARLEAEGFPRRYGLFEHAFLVRRNTEPMRRVNEAWHRLYETGAERDQFYLMYLLWKHRLPAARIPDSGNFRKCAFLGFAKHGAEPAPASVAAASPVPVPPPAPVAPAPLPVPAPRKPAAPSRPAPPPQSRRATVNWVMNADNAGWAYGNNATLLSGQMPEFAHVLDAAGGLSDVALYFDIKLFLMHGIRGRSNVLRVGGPRPVFLAYNYDFEKLAEDIAVFDAVIVLNEALYRMFAALHPQVVLIPNALDLEEWAPRAPLLERRAGQPFTVGFSGNLKTTKERRIKGFDLVAGACERMNLPLLHFGKGQGQIPRAEMPEKFYGQIDVLLHPVLPGKEGCSNVIMEALSLGVPVITTPDCGFHGERVKEGEGILYCRRDEGDILDKLARLRDDPGLRARMSAAGRAFALAHHDVRKTGPMYRDIFTKVMTEDSARRVHFVPFWEPAANFASSRLRCAQPAELLQGSVDLHGALGLDAMADVAIVSQLASDATYEALLARPDLRVVYDVCDRYFDDEREVGGVPARQRFFEMAARADVIVGSTIELKRQISRLNLGKPVVYIPDGIDYRDHRQSAASDPQGPVLWYGNPGRNNFDSARWMIDHVLQNTSRRMQLISRKKYFRHIAKTEDPGYAPYFDICVDWNYDSFVQDMRACSVCVLSHAPEENTKSPNRLITAVANGVPVITSSAPSCEALLRAGGMEHAIVSTPRELDLALERLTDPAERARYLAAMQAVVEERFGDAAIKRRYETLVHRYLPPAPPPRPTRVLFVSHNLNVGEGAPTSLLQTVLGLAGRGLVEPLVFAAAPGRLREAYEAAGVEVFVADYGMRSRIATKVMARTRPQMTQDFRRLLQEREIDVVVANTATTLWLLEVAHEAGVPGISMIRESSSEHVGFGFGPEDLMALCRSGLQKAQATVFVSDHTRALWARHHHLNGVRVIPNGIDLSHFDTVRALDPGALRDRLGLPRDRLVLLSVGSINARKSQADIVEAVAALPAKLRARLQLVLVGAKPSAYLDDLVARVAALGLEERVSLVPETDEVALWYRAADLFVFASKNESYPRVIVEAMSFGLPIISSAVFGTQEQILEGESGLLFPPGDVPTLTAAIRWLATNAPARARFARQAETRFWELVSHGEMVQQYHVLIERAAETARTTMKKRI